MRSRTVLPLVFLAATALLAGCSSAAHPARSGVTSVVASTDVWGDVVKQVGGDAVAVTSVIDDPAQDPHSYEADAKVQLEISKAQVVVENGGGYDDFVDTMRKSSNSGARVINAVDVSGLRQGEDLNEHVWYDFPTVAKVADRICAELTAADPAHGSKFQQGTDAFKAKLTALESREGALKARFAGQGVAITEPVPLYLLGAIGLVDKTPTAFSKAIEDGTDVAPTVLADTLALFTKQQVKLLVYNEQTSGPETEKVLAAAKTNGLAAVPVTETLPADQDYVSWMTANLDAVEAALTR